MKLTFGFVVIIYDLLFLFIKSLIGFQVSDLTTALHQARASAQTGTVDSATYLRSQSQMRVATAVAHSGVGAVTPHAVLTPVPAPPVHEWHHTSPGGKFVNVRCGLFRTWPRLTQNQRAKAYRSRFHDPHLIFLLSEFLLLRINPENAVLWLVKREIRFRFNILGVCNWYFFISPWILPMSSTWSGIWGRYHL